MVSCHAPLMNQLNHIELLGKYLKAKALASCPDCSVFRDQLGKKNNLRVYLQQGWCATEFFILFAHRLRDKDPHTWLGL